MHLGLEKGKDMILQELIEMIEERYPLEYACDWDNSGLQVGDRTWEVDTVYVALDAVDEVIEAAKAAGANLLLTHHPLLFSGIKQVTADTLTGRKVMELLEHKMASYAMHTNYDSLGLAELTSDRLGLTEAFVLEEVLDGEGIGRVGYLPKPMTLGACAQLVKERFCLPNVKVFGDLNARVSLAALSPGAGKSMTKAALEAGADVLITGDIDHHTGIDLWDTGLPIIDAGHYGTEYFYVEDMKNFLAQKCPSLKVVTAPVKHPFQVV